VFGFGFKKHPLIKEKCLHWMSLSYLVLP